MIDGRPIVLVTGAALSGVTSVAGALADRLKRHRVVERLEPGEQPAAVVFVVSAAAPLTESDAGVLDVAAANTDAVVAAVSKIDVHRTWPQVLDADRALLARHAARYARLAWVPVAADPHRAGNSRSAGRTASSTVVPAGTITAKTVAHQDITSSDATNAGPDLRSGAHGVFGASYRPA